MATSSLRAPARDSAGIDAALLVLRVTLGVLILLHGIAKLPPPPPEPLVGMLTRASLPGALAWGVYVGEVIAPILLIVGVWTRLAAVLIAINMIFAVLLAHSGEIFSLGKQGGYALELQAMFLLMAVALALAGAGRYSLGGRFGPLN